MQIKENIRVTGLCLGNSPVNGEFHAQRASNAENASIWWSWYQNDWNKPRAVLKLGQFAMPEIYDNWIGLVNSFVDYARQTREVYRIMP